MSFHRTKESVVNLQLQWDIALIRTTVQKKFLIWLSEISNMTVKTYCKGRA